MINLSLIYNYIILLYKQNEYNSMPLPFNSIFTNCTNIFIDVSMRTKFNTAYYCELRAITIYLRVQ